MGKWKKGLAAVLAGVLLFSTAMVSQNDFGTAKVEKQDKLPVMGWSSWNLYQGDVSEAEIKAQADALVETGLAEKGYTYVLLDDGALAAERDEFGNLQPNDKFSNGFKALGDYLHGQNLNFGMQNSAGKTTGSGLPGSYHYELRDAKTYAGWGVDLLKYVFCNNPLVTKPLNPIPGEANGQSFTREIEGMGPEAPAINRIVIKEVKDGVSTYLKTVHLSSDNTSMTGEVSFNPETEYIINLDANQDLSKAGTANLTFDMEKVDPAAKYTVDVYCFNSDMPRWLSVEVNPQAESHYNKFYLKSDVTGNQAETDAESRSIYDVPLKEGKNQISFYLDKDDVMEAYRQDTIRSFAAMDKAIAATGHDMLLSICDWGWAEPQTGWGKDVAHYWRTTADTTRTKGKIEWSGDGQNGLSVLGVYEKNVVLDEYAGPFGYNDPDALAVGLDGLNEEQNRSHFTLWCMMAAPLLLSADLTAAAKDVLDIVGNEDIIALDQDNLYLQAKRFKQSEDEKIDYLVKPLEDGSVALCIFNKGTEKTEASVPIKEVAEAAIEKVNAKGSEHLSEAQMKMFTETFKAAERYTSEDLWNEETGAVKPDEKISVSVPASGVRVFKLAPAVEQEVSVKITQAPETVERGAQTEFKATVTGAKQDNTVMWEIEGIDPAEEAVTRIDDNGVLTVAADEKLDAITVKAISNEDRTKVEKALIKIIKATKPSVIGIDPLEPMEKDEGIVFKDLELPPTITVNTLQNNETGTAKINVKWNEPAEPLTAGEYEIVGDLQIGEDFYNPQEVMARVDLVVKKNPAPHMLTVQYNADSAKLNIENMEDVNQDGVYTEEIMGGEPISLHFTPENDNRIFAKVFVNGTGEKVKETDSFTYKFEMPNKDTKIYMAFRTVDKAALREAVDRSVAFQASDAYEEVEKSNRNKFEKTLKEAQNILKKIDTDQVEIDEAYIELFNAMENMRLTEEFLLENIVAVLAELSPDAYTQNSWRLLSNALKEAQYVLENEMADHGKVDSTYYWLRIVLRDLEYKVDLTELTKLLEKAQTIRERLDKDYEEEGKEAFLEALTKALSMDVIHTQEEVDEAKAALDKAIKELKLLSAKDRLKKLMQEANNLKDLSKYDSASRTRLSRALEAANKALASGTEDEMEQACKALEEALEKMEVQKKPSRPQKDTSSTPMTYGEGTARADVPALIAAQAVQATVSVRSDTTMPFVLKRGKAYCFKMTVLDGRTEIPSFTVGNNSVLKTQFVAQVGSDCYFRVWAVGKPGQGTGVYTAMPGEFPQLKCLVTVG
ncbi:FIVAR domain-containing protein [Clostridium sp. D33t1_170424_F3]|uniref:FIVAR domain-containing protein n=1 Tax=Clostridium sp. D33t1_170424_F3 TaxID=2787099 RepID=UPI0018A93EA3|nr:FIVAR domain-containing protein [Clostridium sp. D33t1_170424_F3]